MDARIQAEIERTCDKARRAALPILPVASLQEIERFEAEAGVELPADYRQFLLTVGNGGRDKFCGLLPLQEWGSSYWLNDPARAMAGWPCRINPAEIEEFSGDWIDRVEPDWRQHLEEGRFRLFAGTLAIAWDGDGRYYSMVLTGPHRGRIFAWGDYLEAPPMFLPDLRLGGLSGGAAHVPSRA